MDRIGANARSSLMAKVRSRDTRPELTVRKAAFALGLRFRLHRRDLPGTPDIVFPKHKIVLLVHGCFWHQHEGCRRATMPKSRRDFWTKKLNRNVERDREITGKIESRGWRVEVIWECETRNEKLLYRRINSIFWADQSELIRLEWTP